MVAEVKTDLKEDIQEIKIHIQKMDKELAVKLDLKEDIQEIKIRIQKMDKELAKMDGRRDRWNNFDFVYHNSCKIICWLT